MGFLAVLPSSNCIWKATAGSLVYLGLINSILEPVMGATMMFLAILPSTNCIWEATMRFLANLPSPSCSWLT